MLRTSFLLVVLAASLVHGEPSNPVTRVVKLVEELKATVEADAKKDGEIYQKFDCFCQATRKEKQGVIDREAANIGNYKSQIAEEEANIVLESEKIKKLEAEIAEHKKSQEKATGIREDNNKAFTAEHADLTDMLAALEEAVDVLTGAGTSDGKTAFLQARNNALEKLSAKLEATNSNTVLADGLMQKFYQKIQNTRSNESAFLATPSMDNIPKNTDQDAYGSGSGEIQGILKNMFENFVKDLQQASEKEARQLMQYETLMDSLNKSIKDATKLKEEAASRKATAEENLAEAKENLHNSTEIWLDAKSYLAKTNEACAAKQKEFDARTAAKDDELKALGEALKVLNENRQKFNSVKAGLETFLQKAIKVSSDKNEIIQRAARFLNNNNRYNSLRLALLSVRLGSKAAKETFASVISAINGLISELKTEEENDQKQFDGCNSDIQMLQKTIQKRQHDFETASTNIERLQRDMNRLQDEIDTCQAEQAAIRKEQGEMKEIRSEENAEFKKAVADDKASIAALNDARAHLAGYYEKKEGKKVAEEEVAEEEASEEDKVERRDDGFQAPDQVFTSKKKHQNAGTMILNFLTTIITDLKNEIANGTTSENESEAAHTSQMNQLDAQHKALQDSINAKDAQKNSKEKSKNSETADQTDARDDRDKASNTLANKKRGVAKTDARGCDWIIKNKDLRREKRQTEVDALKQAIALLQSS